MKKIVSLVLFALMSVCISHAEDMQPAPGGYVYGDVLYAMVLGDVTSEFDEGMEWSVEVSSSGNTVKVSVYCDEGYSLYDEQLDNVTIWTENNENDEPVGILVTDNSKDNAPILGFVREDGQWELIIAGE